jgi:hypothetical protein
MLDFIFAVTHPSHWHSINLHHHPHHYSLPARLLGSPAISWLQERGPGAGVWFNVETKIQNRVCWFFFFLSGFLFFFSAFSWYKCILSNRETLEIRWGSNHWMIIFLIPSPPKKNRWSSMASSR